MPIYDKTELARKAKELSVVRDTLEKVLRLCEILKFFDSNELFSNKLALKGGTAINLLFFNLPRFPQGFGACLLPWHAVFHPNYLRGCAGGGANLPYRVRLGAFLCGRTAFGVRLFPFGSVRHSAFFGG